MLGILVDVIHSGKRVHCCRTYPTVQSRLWTWPPELGSRSNRVGNSRAFDLCDRTPLDRHRETVRLWLKATRIEGLAVFLERDVAAKKGPRGARKVPGAVKRLVWAIRTREHACCGRKIQCFLARE